MSIRNEKEANFNDTELQDIMAEIESLEQESAEETALYDEQLVNAKESSSEEDILDEALLENEKEELKDNVITLSPENTSRHEEQAPVEFYGKGSMSLSMNFPIGSGQAELQVDEGHVVLSFGEVSFTLTESGCEAKMPGGVSFTVPVESMTSVKKAA